MKNNIELMRKLKNSEPISGDLSEILPLIRVLQIHEVPNESITGLMKKTKKSM